MPREKEGVIKNTIKTKHSKKKTKRAIKWCKLEYL